MLLEQKRSIVSDLTSRMVAEERRQSQLHQIENFRVQGGSTSSHDRPSRASPGLEVLPNVVGSAGSRGCAQRSSLTSMASCATTLTEVPNSAAEPDEVFSVGTNGKRMSVIHSSIEAWEASAKEMKLKSKGLTSRVTVSPNALSDIKEESPLETYWNRTRLFATEVLHSRQFEYLIAILIVMNALLIGIRAEEALHRRSTDMLWMRVMDIFFTVFFTVEVVIKFIAQGWEFLRYSNEDFNWNLLDLCLVGSALMEETVAPSATSNLTLLRLLRMLRLVRVVRVIRVMRFCRDLRLLVAGITGSMKILLFALLLLFVVIFMFGVLVSQLIVDYGTVDDVSIQEYYGNLWLIVYTLWRSVLGGIDWGDAADPLIQISPWIGVLFSVYVAFAVLCVLNIVTAVFVENSNQITQRDEEAVLLEELSNRKTWEKDVRCLFADCDEDASGEIDFEEFRRHVKDNRVQMYFKNLGIDIQAQNTRAFFDLLDFDGGGKINLDEFIFGLQRLHGKARSIDLAHIISECSKIRKALKEVRMMNELIIEKQIGKQALLEILRVINSAPRASPGKSSATA